MSESRTAIVVGGGIGGLATAIALSRRGWQVEVLEQAAEIGEVGSGISLWPNGLRALDALGIGDRVRAAGRVELDAGIRDRTGRWLSTTDSAELERRYGSLVVLPRAELFAILSDALPAGALRLGTTVTGIENGPVLRQNLNARQGSVARQESVTRQDLAAGMDAAADQGPAAAPGSAALKLVHTGGVSEADLIVGADGIRSVIRAALWPDAPAPRYAGYTVWRAITAPLDFAFSSGETWGRGERFGIAALSDGGAYVFGCANAPAGERRPGREFEELSRRFGDWADPIPGALAAIDPKSVLRHDIYDLPPLDTFVRAGVALVGDAAHAMTPNLGQGANQAIEDAVTLAAVLDGVPVGEGLAEYDRVRRPRTQAIARRSRVIGAVAHWTFPGGTRLRDMLVRLTSSRSMLDSLDSVLSWEPPQT
ncbi:FAD-dependent monooxygenase [Nocardia yamanashiensis]|uniref:FAD-dependent monooxygenase n=1 Tax=Nocardia yamanashiensis TaxID=209247 RepID=UPI0008373150|nr:FAD-dependent monooxygenase [Nocardia yamanashiensis]